MSMIRGEIRRRGEQTSKLWIQSRMKLKPVRESWSPSHQRGPKRLHGYSRFPRDGPLKINYTNTDSIGDTTVDLSIPRTVA